MRKFYCPYCGDRKVPRNDTINGGDIPCCGEIGHIVACDIEPVASRAWGREFETEIVCPDFDVALGEAEEMVANIDIMASPSIVSKTRDEAGNWRLRVRSYSLD